MNWWSLLKFASPAEWGSSVAFRDTFVETRVSYLGFTEVLGLNPNTQAELRLASAPRFIRRLTSEVLPDLPEQVDIVRTVELSPKERKQYNEFKANLIVPMEGGDLFAQNPMVAFGRLMQLACSTGEINPEWTLSADGISELDFGFEPALPSSLLSEVEDARTGDYAGKRLVLYFASRKLLELYAEQLKGKGVKYSLITGTVNGADRTLAIANFNAGVTDYILLTSAGGEGISLNGCSTMFMVVPETSRIKETQARGRLHGLNRGDSTATHTEYVYFVPENTVIEGLRDAMNDKNVLADNVLGDSDRMRGMLV